MFGDNKPEFDRSMKIYSKLHKRHTALHRVCEPIAAEVLGFIHINGINPSAFKEMVFLKEMGFLKK